MSTVRDIARASGVSAATVSYVLNNKSGEVSPETRERVMRAVRDLGYRAAPHSTRRRTSRTNTVGVIMMRHSSTLVTGLRQEGYFMEVLDGILSATSRLKYATTIFTFDQWQDVHASLRSKVDGRCDGVLFIGPPTENEIVPALFERGVPVVLVCGDSTLPNVHRVNTDGVEGAREAVRYLISQGHRRIAHLSGSMTQLSATARLQGYRDSLAEAGIPYDPQLVFAASFSRHSGYEAVIRLLAMPVSDWPTALFCGNDTSALGALDALKSQGVAVPEQMSVIGFDDIFLATVSDPPLTTVRQPLAEIGNRAMEILHELIVKGPELPNDETLPTTLIIRDSVSTFKAD